MEGGVSDFTRLLGGALADLGAEVHVLTSAKAGTMEASQRVHCHPLMRSWSWRPLYATVGRLIRKLAPDVIDIQYQAAAYGLHPAVNLLPWAFRHAPSRSLRAVPFVVTYHDLLVPYLFPKAGRLRWEANLALARACKGVIVTNTQDWERLAVYPWIQRLELIPIGSNIPCVLPTGYDRAGWRGHWGIDEDTLLLCYFGFLNASKGGEELIAALDRLCREGRRVKLLMIGGAVGASDPTNRAYLDLVQRSIQGRGLTENVIWTGYMPPEEVSASFCSADVCVLPYRDGVSFRRGSFMAALVHGMSIVTTRPQVALPQLRDGENILLVPNVDPQVLSEAIDRLARDRELRQRLGAGARTLSAEFGWGRIAARTLEVFHAVSGR
jgi:glycosyltransferase involved in cell wall biosynthesis